MNPTDETVEKATAELDDNLQPTTEPADKPKSTDKEVAKETPQEDPAKEKSPKDDEGYTADEIEDVEKPTSDVETADIDTSNLNDEAKYIVDNLPFITARIKDGDKIKEVQVKSWTQLPEDIAFASKRDELAFMNALTAQENRARDLQVKFQQTQQDKQNRDFETRENESIREDIAELQRTGELPKFKVKVDDPNFAKDETTKEVQKVLDFMSERNEQYLKEYQQGRAYRHIGFREAFSMYKRTQPSREEAQEDKERNEIAKKTNVNRGLPSKELKRPTVKAGTRIDQILARIDAEEW